jgi:putative endonuclease
MYFVYIPECSDTSFYVGVTNNIERRLCEHETGEESGHYTYGRRPLRLVHLGEFTDVNLAIAHEKQLKGWSRAKKKALIAGNWDELKRLAACRNVSHYLNRPL